MFMELESEESSSSAGAQYSRSLSTLLFSELVTSTCYASYKRLAALRPGQAQLRVSSNTQLPHYPLKALVTNVAD